jgi:two-component system, sensor histidine kinase
MPTLVPSAHDETRLHTLLADDVHANQLVANDMLTRLGCAVEIAGTGVEAVERFRNGQYDVIFMDCQMPELDGFGATEAIRAIERERGVRTPIIAMTAHAAESDRYRCLEAGMDDFISKPVSLDRLRSLLETIRARKFSQSIAAIERAAIERAASENRAVSVGSDEKVPVETATSL